jgi:hypothetical protein
LAAVLGEPTVLEDDKDRSKWDTQTEQIRKVRSSIALFLRLTLHHLTNALPAG